MAASNEVGFVDTEAYFVDHFDWGEGWQENENLIKEISEVNNVSLEVFNNLFSCLRKHHFIRDIIKILDDRVFPSRSLNPFFLDKHYGGKRFTRAYGKWFDSKHFIPIKGVLPKALDEPFHLHIPLFVENDERQPTTTAHQVIEEEPNQDDGLGLRLLFEENPADDDGENPIDDSVTLHDLQKELPDAKAEIVEKNAKIAALEMESKRLSTAKKRKIAQLEYECEKAKQGIVNDEISKDDDFVKIIKRSDDDNGIILGQEFFGEKNDKKRRTTGKSVCSCAFRGWSKVNRYFVN